MYIAWFNLGEAKSENDHPEVVKKSNWNHQWPIIAKPPSWVEDERPVIPKMLSQIWLLELIWFGILMR